MIEFVVNTEGVGTGQNVKTLTGKGLEFETQWIPNDSLLLAINYAYQNTKNDSDERQVEFVPKRQLYIDVRWSISDAWSLTSQYNRIMDRARVSGDQRAPLEDDDYTNVMLRRSRLDLFGGNGSTEFTVILKNIFGQKYYEPSDGKIPDDFPMSGRRVFVELSHHF